ncbi:MAG: bis(5'-nucleosyl)-tetraphosphatase (symmetrical) YqeK [Clostridiales bacterium]|nr:bis(5'-nucleosyl)-tetraphosphatase (symmetrical) YqeK [Clostridiales bacterium]
MKVGLFGGSFDPFHNGHLSMIEGALKAVDKIVVIPSARNPFKHGKILNAAPYRYYMTVDAVERFGDKVIVSDVEFFIPGISYTLNTIKALLKNNKINDLVDSDNVELFWICGSDILPTFDKWYEPDEILDRVDLLVARRPGQDEDFEANVKRIEDLYDTRITVFDIDGIDVSSSGFRKEKNEDQIPQEVKTFIKTNALYSADWLENVSDKAMEGFLEYAIELYPLLKRERLLHTINTAILAVKYAVMYGGDPDKALIAGILHDCAKELPDEQQRKMAIKDSGESYDIKKLWHGPAGALMAKKQFGIKDEEILDAIRYHTTAREKMTITDKVVYLSDKIEPARTYDDLTEVRAAADKDLELGLILCVSAFVEKSKRKGMKLHHNTKGFLSTLGVDA